MLGLIVLLQSLTVAVSGPATSPEYLPLRVAQAEGYFTREGLSVTLRTTREESGAAEALARAQVDLAATSLGAILRFGARAGAPFPRLVFGLTAAPPCALLVPAARAQEVRSLDDLRGTRVGVTVPGAPEHAWFGGLLARTGISAARVTVESLGVRGLAGAIDAGEVHAALVPEPLATRLVREGRATVLADFRTPEMVQRALGGSTVNAALFVGGDRRPRDRHLAAFARALLDAERRIDDRALYLPDGRVTAEQLRQTIRLIGASRPLPATPRPPRPDRMLHLEPLRRALTPAAGG